MSQVSATAKGYPGSKGGSGVAERIIRQMPPHSAYVELFAGHAAVMRRKALSQSSYLIDCDRRVCHWLRGEFHDPEMVSVEIVNDDAMTWLGRSSIPFHPSTLLYADPPYLGEVRTRLFYDFEFDAPELHAALIQRLRGLTCMVMLSGYESTLYATMLEDWRRVEIPTMTRGGPRTEMLWCNFPAPELLHDARFAGKDFRERERIKRKRQRWADRFRSMPGPERQVIAQALGEVDPAAVRLAMRTVTP